jgi:hypothetical protein
MKKSLRLHNYLKTFLFLAIFGFNAQVSFGQVSISGTGSANTYTQDFNTLASTGTTNAITTLPVGWTFFEIGTSSNTTYAAGTGSGNGGNTYSFGLDADRALGGLQSNAATPTIGVSFTNGTGGAISELVVNYTGEQWRLGATSRVDRLDFQYSLNATSLNVGDWIDVDNLDFTAPVTTGTVGAVNGNTVGNRTTITFTITGLSIPNGATFWFRFNDFGASGADDGLAVDDFSLYANAPVIPVSTTWNGTSWSDGVPTSPTEAIIDGIYNSNAGGTQIGFTAKKLTVTTNGNLTIKSGTNITVQDDVINNGSLTVESNANLVQVNNTTNTGTISVKRDTNPLMRFDYVMWSTPVDGTQKLLNFSPLTSLSPAIRFYTYDNVNNVYVSVPDPANTEFVNATGYLIRLPFDHPTAAAVWTGTFSGVPNNGPVSLTSLTPGQFYATGNPYPSTISADLFMEANGLNDALYFWRKTNGAAGSAYATYTLAGGTSPEPGTTATATSGIPNGTIQVGQGFIAKANGTSLVFNNPMRATPNNANQTFRSASAELPTTVEKNRFWLNLSNGTETIGQTLVSYMTGATNGLDAQIDGKYINDSATALTSLIAGEEFTIQGKTLPFTASDVVPLGFKAQTAGNYSISLFDKDGLFSSNGQIIYLRDNLTNTIQNLNSGAYNFTSQAGVFNGRFDVVYQNALSTDVVDFTSNNVYIYNQNNVLNINSGSNTMSTVKVFDVLGRLLAESNKVNASQTQINVPATNQTLIVQITSSEGIVVVKKVAN